MNTAPFNSRSSKLVRRSVRAVVGAVLAIAGLMVGGCTTAGVDHNLLTFAESAPVPTIVARGTELYAAEQAARAQHGCFAVRGEGCSMEPMYVAGTAVVVKAGGYQQLRRGMPVVYASRNGVAVAHMLVAQTPNGWVAAGLNNNGTDVELVTADNLVGVITQAFASKTGSLPSAVAARIALRDRISQSGKMASADRAPGNGEML
jgi:hypothetical protein